ncbi:MAG: hypothetical protein V3V71_11565, partial [Roseateles sp.]
MDIHAGSVLGIQDCLQGLKLVVVVGAVRRCGQGKKSLPPPAFARRTSMWVQPRMAAFAFGNNFTDWLWA